VPIIKVGVPVAPSFLALASLASIAAEYLLLVMQELKAAESRPCSVAIWVNFSRVKISANSDFKFLE
jgi:hypothetical protein